MAPLPLACTVRDCGLALSRRGGALACSRGHSYDVARSGYVNLLQPQDRRSLTAGDSRASVEARASLFEAGVGRTLTAAVARRVAAVDVGDREPVVVDLGSGSGDALAALVEARPSAGIGIDLSTAAAEHAARRFPHLTWVVANADRRIPVVDRSADVVVSLHGRRHAAECARALAAGGVLLVGVPAADDLVELRELVQGRAVQRDRSDAVIAEHAPLFKLVERTTVRERRRLERDALLNLLRGTYRGARQSAAARVEALESLEVTLASELLVFARLTTSAKAMVVRRSLRRRRKPRAPASF